MREWGYSGKSIWQAIMALAGENRDFSQREKRAGEFSDSRGRISLADLYRGSIWQIYSAGKFGKFIHWVF